MSRRSGLTAAAAVALTAAAVAALLWKNDDRPAIPAVRRPVAAPRPSSEPEVISHALLPSDYDQCAEIAYRPRMIRWRPLVRRVVGNDPRAFALVMTFIFVESGGRQFAVSRSGCAGLMQFCDSTALRAPFDQIFDINRIRPCRCLDRRCAIHWQTRRFLETTNPPLHPLVAEEFPCALFDARFVPEQAIRAGWTYINELDRAFEHNLYLTYIGYNSGPHVAARIWRRLGSRRARRLSLIGRVLRRALAPNFGHRARRRARALLRVHLPKIARVYQAFASMGD